MSQEYQLNFAVDGVLGLDDDGSVPTKIVADKNNNEAQNEDINETNKPGESARQKNKTFTPKNSEGKDFYEVIGSGHKPLRTITQNSYPISENYVFDTSVFNQESLEDLVNLAFFSGNDFSKTGIVTNVDNKKYFKGPDFLAKLSTTNFKADTHHSSNTFELKDKSKRINFTRKKVLLNKVSNPELLGVYGGYQPEAMDFEKKLNYVAELSMECSVVIQSKTNSFNSSGNAFEAVKPLNDHTSVKSIEIKDSSDLKNNDPKTPSDNEDSGSSSDLCALKDLISSRDKLGSKAASKDNNELVNSGKQDNQDIKKNEESVINLKGSDMSNKVSIENSSSGFSKKSNSSEKESNSDVAAKNSENSNEETKLGISPSDTSILKNKLPKENSTGVEDPNKSENIEVNALSSLVAEKENVSESKEVSKETISTDISEEISSKTKSDNNKLMAQDRDNTKETGATSMESQNEQKREALLDSQRFNSSEKVKKISLNDSEDDIPIQRKEKTGNTDNQELNNRKSGVFEVVNKMVLKSYNTIRKSKSANVRNSLNQEKPKVLTKTGTVSKFSFVQFSSTPESEDADISKRKNIFKNSSVVDFTKSLKSLTIRRYQKTRDAL
ncbi:hypothetical protein AYI69_g3587 [Smittium culicis]|uniref:Uncharacterized protein n=1 Tax=Smittium culicis TaxID=133412 RepID=A0A1R1YJD0_9FUNG|nr:hypothetical protein AYI69_g3587 [Smittium culicis]